MGIRSWMSRITSLEVALEAEKYLACPEGASPFSYEAAVEIVYSGALKRARAPYKKGEFIIAWQSDGSSVLPELPVKLRKETRSLESLGEAWRIESDHEFHELIEPVDFGVYLERMRATPGPSA